MTNEWHPSQRGYFAGSLYAEMLNDQDIFLVTGDLGYKMFDSIKNMFPERFINCGASEQALMGIAVGLATLGKKVFVYSITPFLLKRPYETISLYVSGEGLPIKLVGGGRDLDYSHDGPSHDARDAREVLKSLPGIEQFWPETKDEIPAMVKTMINSNHPTFISLSR